MKNFILIILICLALISACNKNPENINDQLSNVNTPPKTKQVATFEFPETNQPMIYHVGDISKLGEVNITLNNIKVSKGNANQKPTKENQFLICDLTVKNIGKSTLKFSGLYQTAISDDQGYKYNGLMVSYLDLKGNLEGQLITGESSRGEIAYEVPINSKKYTFIFDGLIWGNEKIIYEINLLK